jgi:hypothetical protein
VEEKFCIAREIIRHEDGLINNRMTWYLILNGVLFNAWVEGIQMIPNASATAFPRANITFILFLLGFLGIFLAVTTRTLVNQAHRQMEAAVAWWNALEGSDQLPPVRGEWASTVFYAVFSPNSLPILLGGIWTACEVMLIVNYKTLI